MEGACGLEEVAAHPLLLIAAGTAGLVFGAMSLLESDHVPHHLLRRPGNVAFGGGFRNFILHLPPNGPQRLGGSGLAGLQCIGVGKQHPFALLDETGNKPEKLLPQLFAGGYE